MNKQILKLADSIGRRSFIGGSDARIIIGSDEAALTRISHTTDGLCNV